MLTTNPNYFNPPNWHYPRPAFLEEAIKRCRSIPNNHRFLKKIEEAIKGKVNKKQLQALICFSQALLHYTDLASLQYGIWNKDKRRFINFDLKILRKVTGLSTYYFNNSINILKKAGYKSVDRDLKDRPLRHIDKGSPEYNKSFKALPAKRMWLLSFFIDLGFNRERLETCQRDATHKQISNIRTKPIKANPIIKTIPNNWTIKLDKQKDPNGKKHISSIQELLKNASYRGNAP
jgi:hypothetical protein